MQQQMLTTYRTQSYVHHECNSEQVIPRKLLLTDSLYGCTSTLMQNPTISFFLALVFESRPWSPCHHMQRNLHSSVHSGLESLWGSLFIDQSYESNRKISRCLCLHCRTEVTAHTTSTSMTSFMNASAGTIVAIRTYILRWSFNHSLQIMDSRLQLKNVRDRLRHRVHRAGS